MFFFSNNSSFPPLSDQYPIFMLLNIIRKKIPRWLPRPWLLLLNFFSCSHWLCCAKCLFMCSVSTGCFWCGFVKLQCKGICLLSVTLEEFWPTFHLSFNLIDCALCTQKLDYGVLEERIQRGTNKPRLGGLTSNESGNIGRRKDTEVFTEITHINMASLSQENKLLLF